MGCIQLLCGQNTVVVGSIASWLKVVVVIVLRHDAAAAAGEPTAAASASGVASSCGGLYNYNYRAGHATILPR